MKYFVSDVKFRIVSVAWWQSAASCTLRRSKASWCSRNAVASGWSHGDTFWQPARYAEKNTDRTPTFLPYFWRENHPTATPPDICSRHPHPTSTTSLLLLPPPPLPVEFLCSHETTAQCCDSSFSVRVAQLVASVLISTLTSHAGLESYQSQTHLPSQRAQHTCDTCLTLRPIAKHIRDTEQLENAIDEPESPGDWTPAKRIRLKSKPLVQSKRPRETPTDLEHVENDELRRMGTGNTANKRKVISQKRRRWDEMLMDQVMAVSNGTSRVCVNEEKYEPATIRGLPADFVKKGQAREMKDLDDMNVLEWVEESTVPKDAQILDSVTKIDDLYAPTPTSMTVR